MRFFIQFSYFGTAYHGWQYQPNAITVQEVLEAGMSTLFREKIELAGAGRTDAGVHAKEMYAHFDTDTWPEVPDVVFRLNSLLPNDIAVQRIYEVKDDAHARFHAISRTYNYQIVKDKNPFQFQLAHLILKDLDVEAMNVAASMLLGKKDFECFSKSNTDNFTNNCNLQYAKWELKGDMLTFTVTADRFLRNMVRAVVGTLLDIGTGKHPVDYINTVLESKDRRMAGVSVPAKGLYLTSVKYPKDILKNG